MITLSEYLGFIFGEITRARGSADRLSATIAEAYAADPVMKHFSVPRFKIPDLTITIPMLVSGTRYSTVLKFTAALRTFAEFIEGEINSAILRVEDARGKLPPATNRRSRSMMRASARKATSSAKGAEVAPDIERFYNIVGSNLQIGRENKLVEQTYAKTFAARLAAKDLAQEYKRLYPKNELLAESVARVHNFVDRHTVVDTARMQNLLVDPETNSIKTQGNETSVLTVVAKISEEGVFVRSLKNDRGEVTSSNVEFE